MNAAQSGIAAALACISKPITISELVAAQNAFYDPMNHTPPPAQWGGLATT